MRARRTLLGTALIVLMAMSLRAAAEAESRSGTCSIRVSEKSGEFELKIERNNCKTEAGNCGNSQTGEPLNAFTGITVPDLGREGAQLNAVLIAEAGTLRCSGTVHDAELSGAYTFEPDKSFVGRMREIGITGIDPEKLEVYTLFRVSRNWVVSLQKAGVQGIDADNLIALRIFGVDAEYVKSLQALGYGTPPADKLIALRVQGVNAAEIKQVEAMGYHPTLDELIQMRVFHITPDFIQRMKAKGFDNLTIAKLVQIKIFKLAE
jgi:hypothetical protein